MSKFLFLPLLLSFFINASVFSQDLNTPKLDSLFDVLSNNNKAMGSFAISKNGKIVYKRSIGYSNIDEKTKISASENTLYRIGSITKMFTATLIYQLIEEGKLSLNTPLEKFYPSIPNSKVITIESLLNHTNGLYDYVNNQTDLTWITKPQSTQIIIDVITNGKPNALPTEKFNYSNSGYYLLAQIIEKVTKQSYNENLQKRICSKIGLKNTYSPEGNELKTNEAYSFNFMEEKWNKITEIYFPNALGAGDILSTPSELILFNEALLRGKLITKSSLTLMRTHTDVVRGMGIMKIPFYTTLGWGHGGDTYGTHSIVTSYLDDSLTVASCINGEAYPHNDINIAILSICYNKNYELPTFKIFEVSAETLNNYIGIYSSPSFPLKVAITQQDNKLFAQATGQSAFPLEASAKDTFKFLAAGINISFNTDKKELLLKQGGGSYLLTKEN